MKMKIIWCINFYIVFQLSQPTENIYNVTTTPSCNMSKYVLGNFFLLNKKVSLLHLRYWKLLRFIYHIQVVLCVLFFTYIICNSYVVCKSKRKRASPSSTLLLSRNDRKLINPQNKMKGKNKFCLYELKLWQRWEPKKVYIFIIVMYSHFERQ